MISRSRVLIVSLALYTILMLFKNDSDKDNLVQLVILAVLFLPFIGFGIWKVSEDRTKNIDYENCISAYTVGVTNNITSERLSKGQSSESAKTSKFEDDRIEIEARSVCRD